MDNGILEICEYCHKEAITSPPYCCEGMAKSARDAYEEYHREDEYWSDR